MMFVETERQMRCLGMSTQQIKNYLGVQVFKDTLHRRVKVCDYIIRMKMTRKMCHKLQ